jgi:hypothetical protein
LSWAREEAAEETDEWLKGLPIPKNNARKIAAIILVFTGAAMFLTCLGCQLPVVCIATPPSLK